MIAWVYWYTHDDSTARAAALLIPPANRVGGGFCSEETGRSTSRSAFVQVVGLLNTYLPLTVIVFVINVEWFLACAAAAASITQI